MSKTARNSCLFGLLFAVAAILFALLYFLNVIETLNLYMSVNYVVYFVGLSMLFAGLYCKEKEFLKTKNFCYLVGFLLIAFSVALLIYGYTTGNISFFN